MGRAFSVLHITLYQQDIKSEAPWISNKSPKLVVGYVTNGNFDTEQGIDLPTGWDLQYKPPVANLQELASGRELNWQPFQAGLMERVPMLKHVEYFEPRRESPIPGLLDFWVRSRVGERFTQTTLPWLADICPPLLLESYRIKSREGEVPSEKIPYDQLLWYPTVTLAFEAKKRLPESGSRWIRLRATAKTIKNGRNDCEILIFDEKEDLIAVTNVVALVLDAARNVSGRSVEGKFNKQGGGGKL